MTDVRPFLKNYDGPPVRLMEVCGTHTAAISKNGIARMLSPAIRLISGPGCPVCVTVTAYIDRLVELSLRPGTVVLTFGDLMRVPGGRMSLNDAKAAGGNVRMVYSPMDALRLAESDPKNTYVFAAVGFETTSAVYAALLEDAESERIGNLKLLTSLKIMPPVIDWVCRNQGGVDGFIAPGHVSVITGCKIYQPLAERYGIPFVVAGFEGGQLLDAIYALVKLRGRPRVMNLYPSAVRENGNEEARRAIRRYFEPCAAAWRGMGTIPGSGLMLRKEYSRFDAGSAGLDEDCNFSPGCLCAKVLTGAISPADCPRFGRLCTPQTPQGACMVSQEGSCYNYYISGRGSK
ncbi:MAG: hydrogenase formation protein HypD [Oscillospiraceae bacterium]|jgi:hydrogenase expression/formation protein HypD|nr:hydrogenase formation protein HypD [Oscillospiraceae bacterium]MCI1991166.1 hydrogenase formation protein HypD [Oscillospiraceae bacterium]MCI2035407.1 hydrogenase formation protein HypD [Oscillospiraceae bacterium]